MLQGMGPAPCPPEGVLSKQVSCSKSRCGGGDCIDVLNTSGIQFAAKTTCQHHLALTVLVSAFLYALLSFLYVSPPVIYTVLFI